MPQSVSGIKIDTSGKKKAPRKKGNFILVKDNAPPEPKKAAKPKAKAPKFHAVKPQVSKYNRSGSWIVEWEHQQKLKRKKKVRCICFGFFLLLVAVSVFAVLEYLHYTFVFHKKVSHMQFEVEAENSFELTVEDPDKVRGFVIAIKGEPSDDLCETNQVIAMDPDNMETNCLSACDIGSQMEWEIDMFMQRQCNLFTPKPGNYFVASEKEAWAVLAGSKMTTEYVWNIPELPDPEDPRSLAYPFLLAAGVCMVCCIFRRFLAPEAPRVTPRRSRSQVSAG